MEVVALHRPVPISPRACRGEGGFGERTISLLDLGWVPAGWALVIAASRMCGYSRKGPVPIALIEQIARPRLLNSHRVADEAGEGLRQRHIQPE